MSLDSIEGMMKHGLADSLFTSALLLVAKDDEILFHEPYGTLGGTGTGETTHDSLFDLASLTKILATTPLWMLLERDRPEMIDKNLGDLLHECPDHKAAITPRHLLAHASGLPAWRPYYLLSSGDVDRAEFTLGRILSEKLEYAPGEGFKYSDLGFMLLAFLLELDSGNRLEVLSKERVFEPIGLAQDLKFLPDARDEVIALTRVDDPAGIVNDLNARRLGGVAGHAGLFGTARGVSRLAQEILLSLKTDRGFFDQSVAKVFCSPTGFPFGKGRGLGFQTAEAAEASCGDLFSRKSLGHTGFTGTSLWIDPEIDLITVLLTNRVFMGESDFRIKDFRPAVHTAVIEAAAGMAKS
ncbi:serine hydrolase domain-containing protein [Thermodesulfobacteriota bacterium]